MDSDEARKIYELKMKNGARLLYEDNGRFIEIKSVDEWQEDGAHIADLENGSIDLLKKDASSVHLICKACRPSGKTEANEVVVESGEGSSRTLKRTHPSYGVIRFGRVSGHASIFDSELNHQHYIQMTVSRAKVYEQFNTHSRSVHPEQGPSLISVNLSEVQFARAITSLNAGVGTPATLDKIDGVNLPLPPSKENELDKHEDRLNEFAERMETIVNEPVEQIRAWRSSKHRPTMKEMGALADTLERKAAYAKGNAEFIHSVLVESMEDTVASCKTEVDGYVHGFIQAAGIQAIAIGSPLPESIKSVRVETKAD